MFANDYPSFVEKIFDQKLTFSFADLGQDLHNSPRERLGSALGLPGGNTKVWGERTNLLNTHGEKMNVDSTIEPAVVDERSFAELGFNHPLESPAWKAPLHKSPTRKCAFYLRLITWMFRGRLISVGGNLDQLDPSHGARIFVFNHNQRIEAALVPAVLSFTRKGKLIHFMADWQFLMVPLVRGMYKHGQTIIVTTKPARPKFLNVFKPKEDKPAFDRAVDLLRAGSSVGLFPEAMMNRDPNNLLRGMPGAAKMSLSTGVEILPVGIRFPGVEGDRPIGDTDRFSLHVGMPIQPPPTAGERPGNEEIRQFHSVIMRALEELSGKTWQPDAKRRSKYVL